MKTFTFFWNFELENYCRRNFCLGVFGGFEKVSGSDGDLEVP